MLINESLQISKDVVYEKVGGDTVLLHLGTGTYFGLNPIGGRMWELLAETGKPQTVLDRVQEEFDVSTGVLRQDLDRLLNELADNALITFCHD
jgi:Coenzyme PQQ synthesis protein D (PqqD)